MLYSARPASTRSPLPAVLPLSEEFFRKIIFSMNNQTEEETCQTPAKRRKKSPVWLDLLPYELCFRIASMLPPWKLVKDGYRVPSDPVYDLDLPLLQLAAVSKQQKKAVVAFQNRILDAGRVNGFPHAERLIRSWYDVLGNDIREVNISTAVGYSPSEHIHNVLSLPSIVKASIPHCRALLNALFAGGSVNNLTVEVTPRCFDPEAADADLIDVVQHCAIEHLRIVCVICSNNSNLPCYAANYMKRISAGRICNSVRSLEVKCFGNRLQTLASAAFAFPNMERLQLEHWLRETSLDEPDEVVIPFHLQVSTDLAGRLRSLRSVGLVHCGKVDDFAPILGNCLTTFISRATLTESAVKTLEKCPQLESLALMFACGADTKFPMNLRSLRSISLSWILENNNEPEYYTPPPEFLIGLVQRNEGLQELCLQNVKLPLPQLEEVLMYLGGRLQSLQLPILGGKEAPPNQIRRMMPLVMKHNPNIVELVFGAGDMFDDSDGCESGCCFHEFHGFFYPQYDSDCEDCEPWKRVDVMWQVLNRRLPRLSPGSINKLRWSLGLFEQTKDCAVQ